MYIGCVAANDQCDWPHSVDCNFDPASVKKLSKPTYLYLTFDDGPNEGTPSVLRALKVKTIRYYLRINLVSIYFK